MTQLAPAAEDEVRQLFADIGCPLEAVEWKQQGKDKWMCLLEFRNLMESLFAMGSLQGRTLSSNRKMKLSFTRSKLQRKVRLGKVYEPIREND